MLTGDGSSNDQSKSFLRGFSLDMDLGLGEMKRVKTLVFLKGIKEER